MTARPLLDAETSVTEAIVTVLEEAGIEAVFGMSGGNTGRIYSTLAHHTDTIRTVLVRNEANATSAAEAYARSTGKVAVAMAQGSWLIGQGIVGILEALLSGTPMILLGDLSDGAPYTQHGPYQSGTGDYGSWGARATYAGLCKEVFEPHSPVEAVQCVQLAIKHALSGQPGPVAVLFHSTSLIGTVGPESIPRLYSTAEYLHAPSPSCPDLTTVLDLLRIATFPVVIAGGGVRAARAEQALLKLSYATGATVVTTAAGKGTFPEEDKHAAGVFGNFGAPGANAVLAAADLVLVLGSKLGPSDTASESSLLLDPTRQRVVQIDIEPRNAAWTFPVEQVLVADARTVLDGLVEAFADGPMSAGAIEDRSAHRFDVLAVAAEEGINSPSSPLHPQRAISELRNALPDDVIVCADAGENRLLMCRYFQTRSGGRYLQPAGAGGMGYAIPAALGAKTGSPERTVVAVCGDGGFSMSMPALFTAIEEELPVVVVVFDNGVLGWVKHSQRARGEVEFKSTLAAFDYTGIGSAFGMLALHVSEPADLAPAVVEAVKSGRPALVVVDVSTEQTFVDLRSPLLA